MIEMDGIYTVKTEDLINGDMGCIVLIKEVYKYSTVLQVIDKQTGVKYAPTAISKYRCNFILLSLPYDLGTL